MTTPSLFISTPCHSGLVHFDYALSNYRLLAHCLQLGWEVCPHITAGNSEIVYARNLHVHKFLQTDCTHFITHDADVGIKDPANVISMVNVNADIIGIPVVQKTLSIPPTFSVFGTDPKEPEKFKVNTSGIAEVGGIGTSFMVISRRVIEAVVFDSGWHYGHGSLAEEKIVKVFENILTDDNRELSEDYGFCHKARKLGFKIYAHMHAAATHYGSFAYGGLPVV